MHYCFFVVAAVQSEETRSYGPKFVAAEFEIPVLQLASFASDPNEK
jgi:hypothetical protein